MIFSILMIIITLGISAMFYFDYLEVKHLRKKLQETKVNIIEELSNQDFRAKKETQKLITKLKAEVAELKERVENLQNK